MTVKNGTIGIALSGGVDSAVCAWLLREEGHTLAAWHMLLPEFRNGACHVNPDKQDDARKVAEQLGIPFHVIDLSKIFKEQVLKPFIDAYGSGLTPNPCTFCNPAIKFGALFEAMQAGGCAQMATGHYVRTAIDPASGVLTLTEAEDRYKDQVYFLYRLTPEQIARTRFPLGGLLRYQVREIAEKAGLAVSQKKSSQDICFLPEGDYRPMVAPVHPHVMREGPVVSPAGDIIGNHRGIANCTIGQRKGVGIATGERCYVTRILPESNTIVAGGREDLLCREFTVSDVNWILPPAFPFTAEAQTRYHKPRFTADVTLRADGRLAVTPHDPQEAIAPGQACVFYRNGLLSGGGVIDRPSAFTDN